MDSTPDLAHSDQLAMRLNREILSPVCSLILHEKVIRDSNINSSGHIFSKSIQLPYADDTDLITLTLPALKQAFLALKVSNYVRNRDFQKRING
ncbi:hypothetical protein TNCV_1231881 [Trichonephila clavipes]|nr:hypothetical protein TNCV_1231881 [Trichonephila clavipes]